MMQLDLKKHTENGGSQVGSEVHETISSADESEETLSTIQMKLLSLQLKYIRKLLKEVEQTKPSTENGSVSNGKSSSTMTTKTTSSSSQERYDDQLDLVPVKLGRETQETKDNGLNVDPCARTAVRTKDVSERDYRSPVCCTKDHQYPVSSPKLIPPGRLKTCANSHYHFKLPDLPFIVGQSCGVSHSVTANVQRIIGMMKMHNPALCKAPVSTTERKRSCCESTDPKGTSLRKLKKEVKKMARELSDLTTKQEMLKQKLEAGGHAHNKNQAHQEYNDISKLMQSKAKEIIEFHKKINQQSRDQSPSQVPTRDTTPDSTTRIREPKGKTIEAGKVTKLKMPRQENGVSDELQSDDLQWTG